MRAARRTFYAQALEYSGRPEKRGQCEIGAVTSGDLPWMLRAEGACMVELGREQDASACSRASRRRSNTWTPMMMLLRQALGQTDEAFVGSSVRS
jgi:hypothetical protein